MAVSAQVAATLSVTETFSSTTGPAVASSNNSVLHSGFNSSSTLTASSSPAATDCAFTTVTLSSGSATLDLTAITHMGASKSLNALSIRAIIFKAKSDNANVITVAKGATNGYAGLGASFSASLYANKALIMEVGTSAAAIGSSNKTLDVSGTGSQVLYVGVVVG